MPDITKEKLKQIKPETANDTTRMIVNFLNQKGCYATRINNTGIYDKSFGGFRKSHTEKGVPDILVSCYGNFLALEIKKKDKQSPEQITTQQRIEKSGGKYYIIHSFEEFMQLVGNFI